MRTAVIGAGAVGSLAAWLLHLGGAEVVLYERREERLRRLREEGIVLRGAVEARFRPRLGEEGEMPAPFDLMVLAVDAGRTGEALRPLSPFVHRGTAYLSLQDGFAAAELASLVGGERTFVALPWLSAEETSTGEVEVEELRALVLGPFAGVGAEELERMAGLFARCPCGVDMETGVIGNIWERLMYAGPVSGICAVAGTAPGEARRDARLDELCGEAAEECLRVALAAGVELPRPGSVWDGAVWRKLRPPMLRRVEGGGRTEVDWMSGRVVETAREAGVPVPVHGAILSLVRELESGRHRPGEAAVRELARRAGEERGMSLQ